MMQRPLARWLTTTAALAVAAVVPAEAATNTVEILNATLQALPSCIRYEFRGVCFWLKCGWGCSIKTSVRVRHYVPDVIVSTYNEPAQHPWAEVGRPIASLTSSVGGTLMGGMLDSSANDDRQGQEEVTYKSVDVIGNPVGMLSSMLSGNMPSFPNTFTVPNITELASFPTSELPAIARQWASVPAQLGNEFVDGARRAVSAPSEILSKLQNLRSLTSGSMVGGRFSPSSIGLNLDKFMTLDLGPLEGVQRILDIAGGDSYLCPGSASMFGLHFLSDLDSPFWRGLIPTESLYPGAWIPGINEVSDNGLISTWGNVYPRTGVVTQTHPVKASAVIAERAASIVRKKAQAHIYTRLSPGGSVRYFETFGSPKWQMVYPSASGSCTQFGNNDSASLSTFGDGKTSAEAGYVWNLWHRYDCCRKRGAFLYSVP